MNRRVWQVVLVAAWLLSFSGAGVVLAGRPEPEDGADMQRTAIGQVASPSSIEDTYNTTITVTSGTDPDDSKSKRCSTEPVCTLRRAIVESRWLSAGELPALIEFDIPADPAEGYNSSLGVWEIEVYNTTDLNAFRYLLGQVTIDGSTQPGGRSDGPKIILIGPGTGQKTGLNLGETASNNENTVRGLGMQNFGPHININSDENTVEDCWFGLSSDGTTLTSGDDTEPEDGTAISLSATADRNVIRNNKIAGFFGAAVALRGDENTFSGNWLGMRADGTVPIPHQFDKHPCMGNAWAGGSGITVDGDDHQIGGPDPSDGNRFAGLYLDIFGESEQPFAIQFTGSTEDVLVQNNVIGLDASDETIGICGRGIKLSNGPEGTQVISNTIVEPGLSAILMNHWTLNGNTLWGNIIGREAAWPGEQGDNTFPEGAIAYGDKVPEELSGFRPAKITEIDGADVSGTSGAGSECPFCTVELFLDDKDTVVEALESLASVTADSHGNWSATLPAPLEEDEALRTMSTVPDDWTITGLDAGTTSNLSVLYGEGYQVFLPLVMRRR
jgi:hypothetical protein